MLALPLCITWLFYFVTIGVSKSLTVPCSDYNIRHQQQDESFVITFETNDLLKYDRRIRCATYSAWQLVQGCSYHCLNVSYGSKDQIWIELTATNGSMQICAIDYKTQIQIPSLIDVIAVGDHVRVGLTRPLGLFDYVFVRCINNETYRVFDQTEGNTNQTAFVKCSFPVNMSLISVMFETHKLGFAPAVTSVFQQVPLPIAFTYVTDSLLLTVMADPPVSIDVNNTYEFYLLYEDPENSNVLHPITSISDLDPHYGVWIQYGLVPHLTYTILFVHRTSSGDYARSSQTFTAIFNYSYPYPVRNVRIFEGAQDVLISWDNPHYAFDPIEFLISCNSSAPSFQVIYKNTSHQCPYRKTNMSHIISIRTRITLPSFVSNQSATTHIDVQKYPTVPIFNVTHRTETSITLRRISDDLPSQSDQFEYRIQCEFDGPSVIFDVQQTELHCQSLEPGTEYSIVLSVCDMSQNLCRSKSITGRTVLLMSEYVNHFYSWNSNATRSVIIEWKPPEKNFDTVLVQCPSATITYRSSSLNSTTLTKCLVTSGSPFNISIRTVKRSFESVRIILTDTAPDLLSTVQQTTSVFSTVTIQTTATTSVSTTVKRNLTTSSMSTFDPGSDFETLKYELERWRMYTIIASIVAGLSLVINAALTLLMILLCCRRH